MAASGKNETDLLLEELGYDLHDEYAEALSLAELDLKWPVLEVATGSGRMAGMLSDMGYTVYSGDISCDAYVKMRERLGGPAAGRITFIPFDAVKMPFPSGAFRGLVCANALHEMQQPRSVLSELIRVCCDNGRLLITDFNDGGLDVMTEIHRRIHGRDHNRGCITACDVTRTLSEGFAQVEHRDLALTHVWVASGKIIGTGR